MRVFLLLPLLAAAYAKIEILGKGLVIEDDEMFPSGVDGTRFDRACLGSSSSRTFTIRNTGTDAINMSEQSIQLDNAEGWNIVQPTASSLAAGASATFDIEFSPTTSGQKYAEVSFIHSAGTHLFGIAATAAEADVEVQDATSGRPVKQVDFGTVQTSGSRAVYAVNRESCQTSISSISIDFQTKDGENVTGVNPFSFNTVPFKSLPHVLDHEDQDGGRLYFNVNFNQFEPGSYAATVRVTKEGSTSEPYIFQLTAVIAPPPWHTLINNIKYECDTYTVNQQWCSDKDANGVPACTACEECVNSALCNPVSPTPEPTPEPAWSFTFGGITYGCADYATNTFFCDDIGTDGLSACSACAECEGAEKCLAEEEEEEAGFKFEGCNGGSGSFQFDLTKESENKFVGDIPAGQVDLEVELSAVNDLDIRIYDSSNTSNFPEGEAIVAWCADASSCNLGLLNTPGYNTATYKDMQVAYSGYDGVDGKQGNEYIKVDQTKVPIRMTAFAFATGKVDVTYSWSKTVTGCCLGTEACEGEFLKTVPEKAILNLGDIPIGVKNLEIYLTSTSDVDIQLYDKSNGNRPIVKYVASGSSDDLPPLGPDPDEKTVMYETLNYTYSGYNGITVDGVQQLGNEFIRINGVTNVELNMKAFGYAAGQAEVRFSYFY